MHEDLLRRALESKKTTSRKQQSKSNSAASSLAPSRAGSAKNSPAASRTASRAGSDDEDAWSDDTSFSAAIAGLLDAPADWATVLEECIGGLAGTERDSKTRDRARDLQFYVHILRVHFAGEQVEGRVGELLRGFLKAARGEAEAEAVLGLKAIAVTAATSAEEDVVDICAGALRHLVVTAGARAVKVQAVQALGAVSFFGHLAEEELEEPMGFLLEIAETDGASVEALDDGELVAAALQQWALLVTSHSDDFEDKAREAMDVLVDQLESSDPAVQTAAGEAIALLFEKSYTEREEGDEVPLEDGRPMKQPPRKVKRYDPYARTDLLLEKIEDVIRTSAKRISKKKRRFLHSNFGDIKQTVETPMVGPGYSSVLDGESGYEAGYKLKQRVARDRILLVQDWWVFIRLRETKRILGPGLGAHFEEDPGFKAEVFEGASVVRDGYLAAKMDAKAARAEEL